MTINDCKFRVYWDYECDNDTMFPTQKDWNNTLITKINQVSASIHKSSLRGGADLIIISEEVLNIFETLEYYDITHRTLSGRYGIIVDDNIVKNHIFILRKEILDDFFLLPKFSPGENVDFPEISLDLVRNSDDNEEVVAYKRKLKGCVIINDLPSVIDNSLINFKKTKIKFGF